MFGIYDTVDSLWLGNEDGPLLYVDAEVAATCAQIADRCLHQPMGRTRPLPYSANYTRLRDRVPILTDPVTALGQLEDGW